MPAGKKRGQTTSEPPAGNASLEPSKMKVVELKEELEKRGLETSGKKAELAKRLEDALNEPPPRKKVKVEPSTTTKTATTATTAATTTPDYSKMKMPELKKELQSLGLATSGKKTELVARLEAAGATGGGGKKPKDEPKKEEEEEEKEETDFGKAMRALTTAESSKKKTSNKRKVDTYAGSGPMCSVVDDWDCMLNQTNIGQNNNKFYVIQLLKNFGSFMLFTRWGRVGEPGQQDKKCFGSLEDAQREFKKKFADKTRNKWENRHEFVPVPKKYTLLEMDDNDEEDDICEKLAALEETDSGPAPTVVERPCTLDSPTQSLIKLIFNTDTFSHAMKALDIDTKKMPLGKLSKAQIAKGFEALEEIEKALDSLAPRATLERLSSKFYTIIPHDFGRRIPPPIGDKEQLQKKFDMLVVLGDIELAQGMQKDQDKKKVSAAVSSVPHKLDVKYESLKTGLTSVDPSSHEHQVIVKYMEATKPQWRNLKLEHVWRVDRDKADERYKEHDGVGNRRLLWHGTNVAVVAAILKSGLRIMPHSGGRVGKGIYLASENSKSAGYVRCAANGTGIMFLNEAALGKQHIITMDNWTLTKPPDGHDSILAKGKTEPDPSNDISLPIGGHPVSVPQGKPIPTTYSASNFSQSEYLVYKESQTRIRYMLQIKFT